MYHYRKLKCLLLLMLVATTARAQLADGKVYNFVNVGNDGQSMVITSNNMATITATNTESYDQLWYVSGNANDGYSLRNLASGRYLRSSNTTSARWTLVKGDDMDGNCKFNCVSAGSGYTLRATNDASSYGYMHYGANNGGVVCWESSATATQWTMNVVEVSSEDLTANWNKLAGIDPDAATVATYQTHLDNLFSDKSCTTPKKSLTTEEAIKADADYLKLPEGLQDMVLKVYLDSWAEDNYDTNKSAWDTGYAKKYRVQLYEPYNERGTAATALGIWAHTNMNNPTGIFANAEKPLYVLVEGEIEDGSELYIASVTGHGKLGEYNEGIELHEGLNVIPSFVDGNNYYINYVVHTFDTSDGKRGHEAKARKLSDYEPLKIHIEGGYINGYYNKMGDDLYTPDKNADWEYIEARATQTDVTVLGEYMTLQFPLNDDDTEGNKGLSYYLNERVNIEDVIDEWDKVMIWERLLLGVLSEEVTKAEAKKSPYSDKEYVFEYTGDDAEFPTGYGDYYNIHGLAFGVGGSAYMYGSWDHCGYHYNTMGGVIEALPTSAGAHWGPGHEIGHQHQQLLNMRGLTEVTNNLFSNVVLWYYGETTSRYNGDNGSLTNVLTAYNSEGSDFFSNNIWAQTIMYYKLFLYYHVLGHNPKFYPTLFEMLRQDPMGIEYEQDGADCLLHFYKKCCLAAGEDLTEFFRAYGFFSVMENRYVGDYSSAEYNMTQEQIDESIAEVKALAEQNDWNENLSVLFINDATGGTILSHKGDTLELYGETTICATSGSYATFTEDATSADYTYSVSGNTITMEGTGGVGFAIYNKEGELIGFSDKSTFTISEECAALIASGEAEFKVINADNTTSDPVDVMDTDDTEAKYEALGKLLDKVEPIVNFTDESGTKVGYYRTASVTDLQSAYTAAKTVYDAKTTASYTAVFDVLYQEYVDFQSDDYARIGIVEGNAYQLVNKLYPSYSMSINSDTAMIGETTSADSDAQRWYFESSGTNGRYYLKNKSTSTYPGNVSTSAQLSANKAESTKGADGGAYAYELRDMGSGLWALVGNTGLHCDASYNIVGWGADTDATQWYITAVEVDDITEARYKLEDLIAKTEALMAEVGEVTESGSQNVTLTEESYYCNARCLTTQWDVFSSYGVLYDGNAGTYLHTDYSGNNSDDGLAHYIRMDVGVDNTVQMFKINYTTRQDNYPMPPTSITIEGSNDLTTWHTIEDAYTEGLPTGSAVAITLPTMGNGVKYRYIRFMVNSTVDNQEAGPEGNKHIYFALSELGISKVTYAESLNTAYSSIASGVLLEAFEANLAAQGVLATATTSAEYEAAYTTLETQYNALLAARKAVDDAALKAKKAELQTWITNTTNLIASCGGVVYTPAGENDVAMYAVAGSYPYLSCPNLYNGGGDDSDTDCADLLDTDSTSYIHTNYNAAESTYPHYLQVDFGENSTAPNAFRFVYKTRHNGVNQVPKHIKVKGSNDGEAFNDVLGEFTSSDTSNPLPTTQGVTWISDVLTATGNYRYLRFEVIESAQGTTKPYFVMAMFGLKEVTDEYYTVEFSTDAGGATEALMIAAYAENASAQATYDKATTVNQVEAAIAKLQADYEALTDAKNSNSYVTYTVQVDGGNANGGVTYNEANYVANATFEALPNLTEASLTAIALDGYVAKSITITDRVVTVIYNKVYTVQVTGGGGNGGVTFGEQDYADDATFDAVQSSFTAEDLTAIVPDGYTLKEVTVDHETGVISVSYAAIPLVDTTKYYTLACKATDHDTYIRDLGTSINGRSAEGSLFLFEAADEDNGYYIKSYVSEKYLNCTANDNEENDAVVESEEKLTVWKMAKPSHTDGVVTLTAGHDKYLNNNGDAPTYLLARYHSGGPGESNACSLWTLTEGEPLDMSDLATLIEETNNLIASCYTDDVLNYVNSAHVTEESLTAVREVVADAQAKHDSKATVASEYTAAMTALQEAKDDLASNIALANTEATERNNQRGLLNELISDTEELITLCGTTPGDATQTLIDEVSAAVTSAQTVADNTGSTVDELTAATTALQAKYDVLSAAQQSTAKTELLALIEQTNTLIEECGVIAVSPATEFAGAVTLQTDNEGDQFYLSTNAPESNEGENQGTIDKLLDDADDSYYHSTWSYSVGEAHYLQVDMGESVSMKDFVFSYKTKHNLNSPYPTEIVVSGSNDKSSFKQIAVFNEGLPTTASTEWSATVSADRVYRYLRFTVTTSAASGVNCKPDGTYYCFAMSKFGLTAVAADESYYVESLDPNGSVTEAQLLEVYNANVAAEGLANTSASKTELEEKKTELQALYDALLEAHNTQLLPVIITTDHENPVLYTIKSKRGDTKVLGYVPASDHMFDVVEVSTGSAKQAFYFTIGDERTQVYVHPYAAGEQVLSANDLSDGAAKAFAKPKGEAAHEQWKFVERTVDEVTWYNLQPAKSSSTYFSNFGGVGSKMGFYSSTHSTDDGSLFQFESTIVEGSGAYNSLKIYYDEATKGTEIVGSNAVGYYSTDAATAYNAAYASATELLDETSDYAGYLAAYHTLLEVNENLEINMPEEDKFYTIVNAYHANSLMYATTENKIKYGNKTAQNPEALWTFTNDGYLKNLQTGCSVNNACSGGANYALGEDQHKAVSIESVSSDGKVLLIPEGGQPMHASNGVVMGWNAYGAESSSAWRIVEVEVEDMSLVKFSLTVGQHLHAGLYLNYPVTIPENVKAYIIDGSDIDIDANGVGTLKLTKMEGTVLPANNGYILDAPAADYTFYYTDKSATDEVSANMLGGSAYVTYREAETGHNYYVFGQREGVVGLYKNAVKYNASGTVVEDTTTATHYKVSANKVLFDFDNTSTQVSSFRFRIDDEATDIENVGVTEDMLIYDLCGRRIMEVKTSGLYIINGEKRYVEVK